MCMYKLPNLKHLPRFVYLCIESKYNTWYAQYQVYRWGKLFQSYRYPIMILVQKRHCSQLTSRLCHCRRLTPVTEKSQCSSLSSGDGRILYNPFYSLNKKRNEAKSLIWGVYHLFLCPLAVRERQSDRVLLSQGSQLLEELAEDDGTVHSVLHSQCLGLLLQARGPSASAAPEQSAVQWLAAVSYVCEGQLSGVPSPGRAVGVAKDQVSKRWLTALHWNKKTFHLQVITVITRIWDLKWIEKHISWFFSRAFKDGWCRH